MTGAGRKGILSILFYCVGVSAAAASGQAASKGPASPAFERLAARARAAQDSGDLDAAAPLFRRALALNPRWDEGWWSLGQIDYQENRYRAAASEFGRVVALDPKYGTARAMLGLCQFEMGQDREALGNIEASKELGIDKDPQMRQVVLYHEGILLQRASRYEQAAMALSSLCLSGVRNPDLAQVFGMVMLHINSRTAPPRSAPEGDLVQHVGRGACLSAANEFDEARSEYEYALKKDPRFPLLHYAYGRFLLESRDRAGAIEAFKQEIAEHPDNVLARLWIAAADYKVDSAAALPYARQAVALTPQSPLPHYMLGLLLLDAGEFGEAIPHLEAARKAFSGDAKVYWSLASAYEHVGRTREALKARAEFARLKQLSAEQSGSAGGESMEEIPSPMAAGGGDSQPK